jgi:hypothetical protein
VPETRPVVVDCFEDHARASYVRDVRTDPRALHLGPACDGGGRGRLGAGVSGRRGVYAGQGARRRAALGSRLEGQLRGGSDSYDALDVLGPAITASGIPKDAACRTIAELEPPRGLYSGVVVRLDADGGLDAALVLRTVYRSGGVCGPGPGPASSAAQSLSSSLSRRRTNKLRSVAETLRRRVSSEPSAT